MVKKTTVIIPTTGNIKVVDAIRSLIRQTVPTNLLLVIDGDEYTDKIANILRDDEEIGDYISDNSVILLKNNTGKNGWFGHRIYASMPFTVDTKYVAFLDEDNWYEDNHIETCENFVEQNCLDWCFALRNIYTEDGKYACKDDCESLGHYWNPYHPVSYKLVDTNCYFLKTTVACENAPFFYIQGSGDSNYFKGLINLPKKYDCTGKYTVNYRLGGNPNSVKLEFFKKCNEYTKTLYNGNYPWQR